MSQTVVYRPKPKAVASESPLEVARRLAGQEPGWVHESQLPLWLIKTYEENARRLAAEKSAAAVQQAIRGILHLHLMSSVAEESNQDGEPAMQYQDQDCKWHVTKVQGS